MSVCVCACTRVCVHLQNHLQVPGSEEGAWGLPPRSLWVMKLQYEVADRKSSWVPWRVSVQERGWREKVGDRSPWWSPGLFRKEGERPSLQPFPPPISQRPPEQKSGLFQRSEVKRKRSLCLSLCTCLAAASVCSHSVCVGGTFVLRGPSPPWAFRALHQDDGPGPGRELVSQTALFARGKD